METMIGQIDFDNLDALTHAEDTNAYEDFVEKFKPKKTTDDCFTPKAVYDVVLEWALKEYNIDTSRLIVRPFYPGGDYEKYPYPENCVVIDNPPFSILSKIKRFYHERGIDYFLFGPTLTLTSGFRDGVNYVITNADITYENGAKIATSFLTNLGDYKITTSPELTKAIEAANITDRKKHPKYVYPDCVVSAARLQALAARGVNVKIKAEDCVAIRALDSQRAMGKTIFGDGFLISEKAAAEKAAADDCIQWELSEREWEIIRGMRR